MNKNELIKRLKEQESAHQVDDYSEGFDDGIVFALELAVRLDEPETLSQKWMDENEEMVMLMNKGQDDFDNVYSAGTMVKGVPSRKLQNILVPKQGKPVVPDFVGEFIADYKEQGYTLANAIFNIATGREDMDIEEYLREHPKDFVQAYGDGYTVEEKKYCIKLGNVYFKRAFEFTAWKDKAWVFSEIAEAKEEAEQLGGIVEEVSE